MHVFVCMYVYKTLLQKMGQPKVTTKALNLDIRKTFHSCVCVCTQEFLKCSSNTLPVRNIVVILIHACSAVSELGQMKGGARKMSLK